VLRFKEMNETYLKGVFFVLLGSNYSAGKLALGHLASANGSKVISCSYSQNFLWAILWMAAS
jgi:hypothetical protein